MSPIELMPERIVTELMDSARQIRASEIYASDDARSHEPVHVVVEVGDPGIHGEAL